MDLTRQRGLGVEFGAAGLEGEMMAVEALIVGEIEGEGVVDFERREVIARSVVGETEDACEETGGRVFILGRHDGVVECKAHGNPPVGRTS